MKTLILGIGNTIMGDDGAGILVVQELSRKVNDKNVEIREVCTDGLNLLECLPGNDRLIVIDAVLTENQTTGQISRRLPENFRELKTNISLPHQFNLVSVLNMGNTLFPGKMPQDVVIFTININEVTTFTEKLSPEVKKAIPQVVELVLKELAST